jgi:SNF2 family DNA or RNA helicase
MKFQAHPYQQILIDHACDRPRGGKWAGMGMGKTVSMLTALSYLDVVAEGPTLVLAPKRVAVGTWPEEASKWDHLGCLRVEPVSGDLEGRKKALRRDANVFTMNYEHLPWLVEQYSGRQPWPFKRVIADESTRLKSFRLRQGGKRAQALGKVAWSHVDHWDNLTGTPAPNGLIDLWGQQWFVDMGEALGSTFTAFRDRWFHFQRVDVQLSGGGTFSRPEMRAVEWAQEEIEDKLRATNVSLRAKDWFDLDEPIVRRVEVELPAKARAHYKEMAKDFYTRLGNAEIEAVHAADKSAKLLQLASGTIWTDTKERVWADVHDQKLEALDSIIEEAAGMPVLVAYQWVPSLKRILKAFPKARFLDDKLETQKAWNRGDIPILVAHPASAGHGLNLQDGGNILVYFDQWWNLEEHDQILERIGPMRQKQSGNDRPVFVYYIIARRTEDERVMLRRETKRSVMDLLMENLRAGGY